LANGHDSGNAKILNLGNGKEKCKDIILILATTPEMETAQCVGKYFDLIGSNAIAIISEKIVSNTFCKHQIFLHTLLLGKNTHSAGILKYP